MTRPIRFAHLSDTHIGPQREFELYGAATAPRLERLVEHLNACHEEIDFVVHTGDVVSDPDAASFRLAGSILSGLKKPCYLVNGNHDSADGLRGIGAGAHGQPVIHGGTKLDYHFSVGAERFLVLDARGPDEIDPAGELTEEQLRGVERWLSEHAERVTIFVHFPALPLDCAWLDRMMLIGNGEALHRVLVPHASRVRGVLSGHVHRGMQSWQDGILYASAPSTFCQFRNWPRDETVHMAASDHVFYNLVTLQPHGTVIRQLWC
jgi:3',5'-cyclic AMP phosphodiesterase CpdA